MAPQLDTAQRRAVLAEIAKKLVLQINEIQPFQWDKHDDKDQAIVLAALLATDQQARREALEEAAKVIESKLMIEPTQDMLELGTQMGLRQAIIALDRLREGV